MSVREVFSYLKSNWFTRKDQVNSSGLLKIYENKKSKENSCEK